MFYDQVEKLCHERKIKPTRLARELGISPTAPGRWREGSEPKIDTVKAIADYFGVSVASLLEDTPVSSYSVTSGDGSAIIQGGHSNTASAGASAPRSGLDVEMMRVFAGLSNTDKARALAFVYDLEAAESSQKDVSE